MNRLEELDEKILSAAHDLEIMKRHNYDQVARFGLMVKISRLEEEKKLLKMTMILEMENIREEL